MRFKIPPPDVPPIEVDPQTGEFRWTVDYYDFFKNLERLRLVDLADFSTTAPTNTQTPKFVSATGLWTPG